MTPCRDFFTGSDWSLEEDVGFFGSLVSPIEELLRFVLEALHSITEAFGLESYGFAIILLTIVIKMLLYPLTVKQIKSMKAMQKLAPKLRKIQEKYKDDPPMLQQKMGALYRDAGVNPLAGCLPMLIQMPILMGMYYALYHFHFEAGKDIFFWLPSLSEPDPLYILPLLSAATTYLMQKQTTVEVTGQMKMMMVFMPLFIGFISLTFPSGLVLYWVTMNVVQIGQQWWMYRSGDVDKGAKADA